MPKKTVNFNKSGIGKLPNDKPVVYEIKTGAGKPNYIGIAKRGRVQERLQEHLGDVPGAKVQIDQMSSIAEAEAKEKQSIAREKPPYNKQGT